MSVLPNGHFLSIYSHIDPLCSVHRILQRHDHAAALWHLDGDDLTLQRYWEFERISRIKGHGVSFPDAVSAQGFIEDLLAEEGLRLADMTAVIGTPGVGMPSAGMPGVGASRPLPDLPAGVDDNLPLHALCHLYSGLLVDSDLFHHGKILCLSLDAGPDSVLDPQVWDKPHYVGIYADRGHLTPFSVPSPALLWALLRERTGLAEGTLMALGSASTATVSAPLLPLPPILSLNDRYAAHAWVRNLADHIEALAEDDQGGTYHHRDHRFSWADDKISMMVKQVQAASENLVSQTIALAIERFSLTPSEVTLSIVGGYALNCPSNAAMMATFGFAQFVAPPVVNDTGIALGLGLLHAAHHRPKIRFSLGSASHGHRPGKVETLLTDPLIAPLIESSSPYCPQTAAEDICRGPIVWFDGAAEIGPRALGNRSLLGDPRTEATKDRLNEIKQREWWRPVAPIIRAAAADDWFEMTGPSPYMLQAVLVRDGREAKIPAICHLDRTARVQTVDPQTHPRLDGLLKAFADLTGVPILCNTSLNDKGEPIIDSMPRAVAFAVDKKIPVIYLDGVRVALKHTAEDALVAPLLAKEHGGPVTPSPFVPSPEQTEQIDALYNPHRLTRRELVGYFSDPRLAKYDICDATAVRTLRRLFQQAALRNPDASRDLLWEVGNHDGGLRVF